MGVRLGIDVLQADDFALLKNRRVGLMTNPSGVDGRLRSTYRILAESDQANLVALFSPEHGFAGAVADGEKVGSMVDRRTGIPVHSLYGETYRPTEAMMADLDVMVCDIQDIGARYYTFLWTVTHILEAAGEFGVEVMIFDRPNPLGGVVVEGGPLDAELASLVGRYSIPIRHGMTLGELAQMMNEQWNPHPSELSVVKCEGWNRGMMWDETGLVWVPPSPNMPHFSTAMQYTGACLIESTRLSEGRGTPLPFEIVGAPFIDGEDLAEVLNGQGWDGVKFRPITFMPTSSKWQGEYCGGVQVHVVDDWSAFRAIETWLGIIREIRLMYADDFQWLPPYIEGGMYHFDRLVGLTDVRQKIDIGVSVEGLTAGWDEFCREFERLREPYLLYE
jgi:uncharacterized protein YbbC (DUF1343 family)